MYEELLSFGECAELAKRSAFSSQHQALWELETAR